MKLVYNIYLEIVCAVLMLAALWFVKIRYSGKVKLNRRFLQMMLFALAAGILEVVTAVGVSCGALVPPWVNIVLNVFYLGSRIAVLYSLIRYVESSVQADGKAAQSRTQVSDGARTGFLKNMSHELRTPINAILGYDELILKDSGEKQIVDYAENVHMAGRVLLTMVNDITDFASTMGGEFTPEPTEYSVLSFLQDVKANTEYIMDKKSLDLEFAADESLPSILLGDMGLLVRIINNLTSNAVKYTNQGFIKVNISWEQQREDRGMLRVQVQDSGVGMSPEEVEQINNTLFPFEKGEDKKAQGMGLGLPIVGKYLELMNSKLEAQSEYGKGSIFSFRVEQLVRDKTSIGKVELSHRYGSLWTEAADREFTAEEARILAVDDNLINLDLLKRVLRDTRVQIDIAQNGVEALECLGQKHYHLILMDDMMPLMDGVETLKQMRERKLGEDASVIALTANTAPGARAMYLEIGFDDYISKPVSRRQLLAGVRKYLPEFLVRERDTEIAQEEAGPLTQREENEGTIAYKFCFLDTELGMGYCGGDEEFYLEMLGSYIESAKEEDIQDCYDRQDWDNYNILVHALKSTSLSIGAAALSENAKALEQAAKVGDVSYIEEHHGPCMKAYETLLGQLKAALGNRETKLEITVQNDDRSERVLVVDDNIMNLQIAERMLEGCYLVNCAQSGREALEFLGQQKVDLILLDLHMPEMDGFQVIRVLKQNPELKDIPVIFLTADNDRETEIRGFQEGASDFLAKPLAVDIMLQRVRRILEHDRLKKDLQKEVAKQTQTAEERREKMDRLSLQVILTLAKTIDAKDPYTNGHSERVAKYSREIARRAGFSEKEQENIYFMGLLHDIGKIGIPDTILNKRSHLDPEEYKIIQTHPQVGADILKNISEIPDIAKGARWHHERYDGKGYPDGIAGEQIAVQARIIGVADAYDAMTSKRSYRDVIPQAQVKAEIARCIGTQFDPVFADIMLQMIEEDVDYAMREHSNNL